MSGRGLGYTGGTIDKLESIKGFKVTLSEEEFIKQVRDIGFAVTGQTSNLCPLDKVIYALRDVTGTTDSIPLIASSIMSKKIAGGADKIFIDIKCGNGAMMKDLESALKLKDIMERIGAFYNHETICEISDMNVPLGSNIGNSLEVLEAMDVLKGKSGALRDLCIEEASKMVSMAKECGIDKAKEMVLNSLNSGMAYNKFLEFVKWQNGDITSLKVSRNTIDVKSNKNGILKKIKTFKLGELSVMLGAGRRNKEDLINHEVGIVLKKHLLDDVKENDTLCTLYVKDKNITINPDDYFEII
jgi:pyrimidine-nucleoside phosphorylase